MSRAFVKESDGAAEDALAERKISPHRNLVTAEGLAQIEAEVERLQSGLSAARAAGDRAALARIRRDLRYWRERRRTAEPVPAAAPGGKARFGSTVTLELPGGGRVTYRIVGEDEADPGSGRISWVSPVGRALIGKGAGDVVRHRDGDAEVVDVA